MKARIQVLTGLNAGQVVVFSKDIIEIGRHPTCDLHFNPQEELEVSARHATLIRRGDEWLIRDRGSLNGTLVNGHRISGDTRLDDMDHVRLSPDGPTFEFRPVPDSVADGEHAPPTPQQLVATDSAPGPTEESIGAATSTGALGNTTKERIQVEVGRQTARLRTWTIALGGVSIAAAGAFLFETNRQRSLREAAVAGIEARADSAMAAASEAVRALEGQVEGLANALDRSQTEVQRLRDGLTEAQRTGSAQEVQQLRRQLADASQALLYQQAAAHVDYRAILDGNQRAVAMLFVELDDGTINTGTAFAVNPDGTMITSQHVVTGTDGDKRPTRIGVKFADSDQVFPAQLLRTARNVDLAAIKASVRGGVPAVRGLNSRPDTLRQGDPVAVLGFPLGGDLPMSMSAQQRTVARTTFSAGSVSKVLADLIQIDGYGAEGSSGSPIFDRNGQVVGVVFGGQVGSEGRIVLGVPADFAIQLLGR